MNAVEIITKKRDGKSLTTDEIMFVVDHYTKGRIPDYQISALLMAIFLRGMNEKETADLTNAMLYSGEIIDLSEIEGIKVDKHSTGGVGDKTSLIIAPIAAAAGVKVPMISGRGLGHTGGTLDKLESIPGFNTKLNTDEFKEVLNKCGAVIIGQTERIAPADRKMYALRDVTGTVPTLPLITSSIMSKKLAEGIDGLVLDVKTGNGAFMQKLEDSEKLALSLTNTAKNFKKKVITFITDMNQPLGKYIGNWLEVYECIEIMKSNIENDLFELSLNLAGAMIYLGGKSNSIEEGIEKSKKLISNGQALDKFIETVETQGGDSSFIKDTDKYSKAKYSEKITSPRTGIIESINTLELGMAAVELGAGRRIIDDKIDPTAGIIFEVKIGDEVNKGDTIAEIFTSNSIKARTAAGKIKDAVKFSQNEIEKPKLIKFHLG
ncbi:MAG: thymidine phosphorylase [Ignavibacteria bacterium]|jgi:pyrimidine-nucleoside phosphorylase